MRRIGVSRTRSIHICRNIEEIRAYRRSPTVWTKSMGFVPTMGALHTGHQSLAVQAKKENEIVIASIFVNPTQFGPHEDLDKYPRTLERDIAMLEEAKVDCVFTPMKEEIYAPQPLCHVEPAAFSNISEGIARPDFFRGVATIVSKLFNIVEPTTAYFGQKDISQCILIKRMVSDLNFPVEIVICETVRATDGLALSSRNVYLTQLERPKADVLYRALSSVKSYCEKAEGKVVITRSDVERVFKSVLATEPLVTQTEYVSVASVHDMTELSSPEDLKKGFVLSSAIRLGAVRLIDNVLVGDAVHYIYSR